MHNPHTEEDHQRLESVSKATTEVVLPPQASTPKYLPNFKAGRLRRNGKRRKGLRFPPPIPVPRELQKPRDRGDSNRISAETGLPVRKGDHHSFQQWDYGPGKGVADLSLCLQRRKGSWTEPAGRGSRMSSRWAILCLSYPPSQRNTNYKYN